MIAAQRQRTIASRFLDGLLESGHLKVMPPSGELHGLILHGHDDGPQQKRQQIEARNWFSDLALVGAWLDIRSLCHVVALLQN